MSTPERIKIVARILAHLRRQWKAGRITDEQRRRLYIAVLGEFTG